MILSVYLLYLFVTLAWLTERSTVSSEQLHKPTHQIRLKMGAFDPPSGPKRQQLSWSQAGPGEVHNTHVSSTGCHFQASAVVQEQTDWQMKPHSLSPPLLERLPLARTHTHTHMAHITNAFALFSSLRTHVITQMRYTLLC